LSDTFACVWFQFCYCRSQDCRSFLKTLRHVQPCSHRSARPADSHSTSIRPVFSPLARFEVHVARAGRFPGMEACSGLLHARTHAQGAPNPSRSVHPKRLAGKKMDRVIKYNPVLSLYSQTQDFRDAGFVRRWKRLEPSPCGSMRCDVAFWPLLMKNRSRAQVMSSCSCAQDCRHLICVYMRIIKIRSPSPCDPDYMDQTLRFVISV
jgi:hypothetical protein